MKRILFILSAGILVALAGCKDLKDQQASPIVADGKTKVYYKNVGEFVTKVPKERRVYFKSADEAMENGYVDYQVGGDEPDPDRESDAGEVNQDSSDAGE